MDLGLKGRKVIVTGGSRGIGRACALEFAAEGADVAICARGQEALDATRAALQAHGVTAFAEACDVGDSDQLYRFLTAARAAIGGCDVLVNNTSGFGLSDDDAGWQAGIDIDLMASVRATRTVTPWMADSGGGAIVHIASISALETGSPPAYTAVKAALVAHSKTMAKALAPQGIRVNCVAPGSIEFPGGMWQQQRDSADPSLYEHMLGRIPFGRMGTPEEVAAAVVFLCSARASWISGATLLVDGVQHDGIF